MSEKFNLKWTDFQFNVTNSFNIFRSESNFCDVTLVCEGEESVKAHKVVLSACSSFFKNILKEYQHSHPLIYLSGVSSSNLGSILDYIYQGEVQIFQEQLDTFLETAQKLKIEGLLAENIQDKQGSFHVKKEEPEEMEERTLLKPRKSNQKTKREGPGRVEDFQQVPVISGMDEAEERIAEIIKKVEAGHWECNICGAVKKTKQHITNHAETHIDGLSYGCSLCHKTYRSKNVLYNHISKGHR